MRQLFLLQCMLVLLWCSLTAMEPWMHSATTGRTPFPVIDGNQRGHDASDNKHFLSHTGVDSVSITLDTVVNVTGCSGDSTGSIFISVAAGLPPFTFQWSNGATSEDLVGVPAGYYSVSVTAFDLVELVLDSIQITEPQPVTISSFIDFPSCNGDSGQIVIRGEGGTAPYTFLWEDSTTSDTLLNVAEGIYDVSITDANGCTATASYTVSALYPLVSAVKNGDLTCVQDTVRLEGFVSTPSGSPLVFEWTASAGGQFITPSDSVVVFTNAGGTYTLTVTDTLNGCTSATDITVSVDTIAPQVDAGADTTLPCTNSIATLNGFGSMDSIVIYQWIAINGGNIISASDSLAITINHSGTYILTGTNTGSGCVDTDTVNVSALNVPPSINTQDDTLTCLVPQVKLFVQVDTANLVWSWTVLAVLSLWNSIRWSP